MFLVRFDVPYSQLASDLGGNSLPAFLFITPNLIDDMHDGTITDGDTWLAANLGTGGKNGENCAWTEVTATHSRTSGSRSSWSRAMIQVSYQDDSHEGP